MMKSRYGIAVVQTKSWTLQWSLVVLFAWWLGIANAAPLGTSFSFQGKLHDGGQPASGEYEFEFRMFDASTEGSQLGSVNTLEEVAVTNGLFTVQLDFGDAAFNGDARWLEIWVRSSNGDEAVVLAPRTPLTATPYALHASMSKSVADGAITSDKLADGAVNGAKIAAGSIQGTQIANGAIGANHLSAGAVNATHISAGAVGSSQLANGAVGSQQLGGGAVTADKLGNGAAYANLISSGQSPIASGGVILSESPNRPELLSAGFVLISKVDMVSAAWRVGKPAPPPAPSVPVSLDSIAVWAGTEMLVWGGGDNFGARYNPNTGAWVAMTTNNAPAKRSFNSAVWTGTEMIVWGGQLAGGTTSTATGARYNPVSDTWTALPTANAPAARAFHTATWTGTEMIVWGGVDATGKESNSGAKYNPISNTWTPLATANAPSARRGHTAVWDGNGLIVWGGAVTLTTTNYDVDYNWMPPNTGKFVTNVVVHHPNKAVETGARYNPAANTWTTITTNNAPSARSLHTAVWDGASMIVWGGEQQTVGWVSGFLNPSSGSWQLITQVRRDGHRYNPANNSWSAIATNELLSGGMSQHTAVWTGSRMLIWGRPNSYSFDPEPSGSYDPAANSWTPISMAQQPSLRSSHSAVWTGTRMLIWGGGKQDGGVYNPSQNTWSPISPTADAATRVDATPIWTGKEMIIWGGRDENGLYLQSGFRYNPTWDTWTKLPQAGAPSARASHSVVWTGQEMIVWGGTSGAGDLNDGARYNPATDTWTSLSTSNAPLSRRSANAVWTGQELIVVGGFHGIGVIWNGARYNPATDTWSMLNMVGAPSARLTFTLQWTGSEMILWGGDSLGLTYNDGARFNPAGNSWTPMSTANAPTGRHAPTSVWTGKEMIVWGGGGTFGNYPQDGARYNPVNDAWTTISTNLAPTGREGHSLIWDGTKMYVFGGKQGQTILDANSVRAFDLERDGWYLYDNPGLGRANHAAVWTGLEMLIWGGTGPAEYMMNSTGLYRPARTFYLYLRP